jgi:hypothetical protein
MDEQARSGNQPLADKIITVYQTVHIAAICDMMSFTLS